MSNRRKLRARLVSGGLNPWAGEAPAAPAPVPARAARPVPGPGWPARPRGHGPGKTRNLGYALSHRGN